VDLIKKYTVIDRLDAAILNELIDWIVVHHKEIAEDGRVFQQRNRFFWTDWSDPQASAWGSLIHITLQIFYKEVFQVVSKTATHQI
jgi:hypothetical protein